MAKRGRKKKFKIDFNISPETVRSVVAVLLLLLAFVSLISFIAPNYALNEKIQLVFRKSFGMGSLLLPLIIAAFGLFFIESIKIKLKELRVVLGLLLFLLTLSGFLHVFIPAEEAKIQAIAGFGGGFVGYIISTSLKNLVSIYGAIATLFALLTVSVIAIFDISIDSSIVFLKTIKESFKKNESNIEVTPGIEMSGDDTDYKLDNNTSVASHSEEDKYDIKDPEFEIIPSLSEPQSGVEPEIALPNDMPKPQPTLPYPDKVWVLPPVDLLSNPAGGPPDTGDVDESKRIIKETLSSFQIPVEVVDYQIGPSVTKYALESPSGVRIAKIANLQSDLALALASPTGSVRIEAPIPGKKLVGIEVPNKKRAYVNFKSLITSEPMKSTKSKVEIVLGKDVGGLTHVYNISQMPHLLIAGATGSGKSIFIHNLIFSILFRATPEEVKFIMIDPKRVELSVYADIPHLYTPLVTDTDKAPAVFKWAVTEMTKRYKLFESARVRNIESYNENSGFQAMPYVVIIVDEMAEIMMADPAAVEKNIIRIAQLARATGIHLVLAAQRPSADVITGLIKANIPCRVAFNVASQTDSRVIIDQTGAEKLLGKGDMLFVPPDKPTPVRLQGAFITDKEINDLVAYLKNQGVAPDYKDEILSTPTDSGGDKSVALGGDQVDAHFDEAAEIVISAGKASASLLQRRLSIGYARAARILDELEQKGIVGQAQGSKPRDVLLDSLPLEDLPGVGEIKTPRLRLDD